MRPAQLAWMAAVLDMKSLQVRKRLRVCDPQCDKPKPHIHKTRAHDQLTLMVESRHLDVIGRLAELTGTAPEARRMSKLKEEWTQRGCKEHCPEAHIHHGFELPEISRWSVSGSAMATVLWSLRPYLLDWGKYETFYTEALDHVTLSGRGATQTKKALGRLIGLGWNLPPALAAYRELIATVDRESA